MHTPVLPKGHQHLRAGVRWPITVLTAHGEIEGEIENITPNGMFISCKKPLPTEGSFQVEVKVPNRKALNATAKSVWTTVASHSDGSVRLGTEITFDSISEDDVEFLRSVIVRQHGGKINSTPVLETSILKNSSGQETVTSGVRKAADARIAVSYKHRGKRVAASGMRFSTKGCHVYTKTPLSPGAVFSLQITNPRTRGVIQVDSSVMRRTYSATNKYWGMVLRFMNLTDSERQQIRRMLEDSEVDAHTKYQRITIGEAVRRFFSRRKTNDRMTRVARSA